MISTGFQGLYLAMDFIIKNDEEKYMLTNRGDSIIKIVFFGQLFFKLADLVYFEFILPRKWNKINIVSYSIFFISLVFFLMGWTRIYQLVEGEQEDKWMFRSTVIFSSLLAFLIQLSRNT